MGSNTISLQFKAPESMLALRLIRQSGLEDALLRKAHNLRCFSFKALPASPSGPKGIDWFSHPLNPVKRAFYVFIRFVLRQVPRIEALQVLGNEHPCFEFGMRLQHLKHLVLGTTWPFYCGIRPNSRRLLPSLETVYLHEKWVHVSVLGHQHLRHVVVKGSYVRDVLHEPNCQLGIHGDSFALRLSKSKPLVAGRRSLGATADFIIGGRNYMGGPPDPVCPEDSVTCTHWADIEALPMTVNWPLDSYVRDYGLKDLLLDQVSSELALCMPIDMHSIRNIKALCLVAETGMPCYIPKDLPKLEELVLFVKGATEVSFEDAMCLFSAVKTFYILGQPVTTTLDVFDRYLVLHSLARRDLCLSTVSATRAGKGFGPDSSCATYHSTGGAL